MAENQHSKANQRLMRKLIIAAIAMFGFGFALVPLYNAMCDALGLNGRFLEIQQGTYDAEKARDSITKEDDTRTVTVEFLANVDRSAPWEFRTMTTSLRLHPGKVEKVEFYAKNLSGRDIVAQAIPSLSPGRAVKYFTKLECFCFHQQPFKAGEEKMMPLRFFVDPHLPRDIGTITLSYTFFESKNQAKITERNELASAQAVLTETTAVRTQ